ncbi:Sec1-like protein [Flagelloscypha sp. PMI_526]|nr:Sec1-like protein [Flagelloscypha sp. PMI_526]
MTSLINLVRSKFLDAIRSVNPPSRWKILVIDEHAQRLVDSVLKQFDILEENVTQIELISDNREANPGLEAMYILMSTNQNIDRIVKDFSGNQPRYGKAHVFFLDALADDLLQRLFQSPAEPYLATVTELFVNYWPVEAQVFSMKEPGLFFSMYSPPRGESEYAAAKVRLQEDVQFISKMISNVCISLDEYPFIRYFFPSHRSPLGPLTPHASTRPAAAPEPGHRWRTNMARGEQARQYESVEGDHVSKLIALNVQRTLDDYKKSNPKWPKDSPRPRGTLIVTDRSMDCIAPFLHEFTYQAMANDLLPIGEEGTKYRFKFNTADGVEDKTATLNDLDNVWTDVRHMHMREAIDKLMADFNKFLTDNAVFNGEGAASLNDMKDMLANLPQFQEQRDKFSLHLNMAEECMGKFEQEKLPLVANVEQECATGLTAEGKTPKKLVEEMVPLLDSRDISNLNKVRIIALYIMHRGGVPEEDKRRLYQHARLSMPEQDAINALVGLGVALLKGSSSGKMPLKARQDDGDYELSRYMPLLRMVIEDNNNNKLDQSLFPYTKDAPSSLTAATSGSLRSGNSPLRSQTPQQPASSLRSARPGWVNKSAPSQRNLENRQRVIVFVAGGMTYSESRECYKLSNSLNKDVIIGSTHTITPRTFVDDLKVLDLEGRGSKALPNGLPQARGKQQRHPQEYYDTKYYTRDAPPPRPAPQKSLAPPRETSSRPQQLSPADSYNSQYSMQSSGSISPGPGGDKLKKKKGFLKF